jgi:hypothetical protein
MIGPHEPVGERRDRTFDEGGRLGAGVGPARAGVGRQRPPSLGPDGGVGAVGLLPLVVVGRALLHGNLGHSPQCEAGGILSLVVQVDEEVAAREHRLGKRHHHLAQRKAPTAQLHRRSRLADRPTDREQPIELGDEVQPGPWRDAPVGSTEHDPGVDRY